MWGISRLAADQLASQEGLCTTGQVSKGGWCVPHQFHSSRSLHPNNVGLPRIKKHKIPGLYPLQLSQNEVTCVALTSTTTGHLPSFPYTAQIFKILIDAVVCGVPQLKTLSRKKTHGFCPSSAHVRLLVCKVAQGQIVLRDFRLYPVTIIPSTLNNHISLTQTTL